MFKKFSLAVVALLFIAGSVMADDTISASDLDSAAVSQASDVVGSGIASESSDIATVDESATEAVEACFRNWGGCNYGYGYNCCYRPCYNYCYQPCYSYCYQPCYTYCYQPVCYTYSYACYQPTFCNYGYWGCH